MLLWNTYCNSKVRLDGKIAIITGGNTGIGKETALDLYKRGADVIILCRDVTKAEDAINSIKKTTEKETNLGKISARQLDLGSFKSIRETSKYLLEKCPKIHILINNAGVFACPKNTTEDGLEYQMGVNHFGHFLLTCLLLPRIRTSQPARIINVSSMGHAWAELDMSDLMLEKQTYDPIKSYCNSKLANILFTKELARKLEGQNINIYVVHPGVVKTEIQRHLSDSYFRGFSCLFSFFGSILFKNPNQGAQTTIYCAVDEKCEDETGLYYCDCSVKEPSEKAKNQNEATQLWQESVKVVKLGDWDPIKAPDIKIPLSPKL